MRNSNRAAALRKVDSGDIEEVPDRPPKPYAGFPLGAHPNGQWQKRIRNKVCYFGPWGKRVNGKLERLPDDGWQAALELYKEQAADLYAGRTPRPKTDALTVADLCNHFLTAKLRKREAGEITVRTFDEYKATSTRLVTTFGRERLIVDLAADDFAKLRKEMVEQWGPVRLGNEIQKVRTVFKYGFEAALIESPIRFGPEFKKPSASVLRRHRAARGERMIEAGELRKLLKTTPSPIRAMLLLGLNCGLGNHDIAMLPLSALDLDGGWLNFPRPKTGIPRRCPLWPETVGALRAVVAKRPATKCHDAADKVFVTVRGRPWLSRGIANPVSVAARRVMKDVGIARDGVGFYTLRHVFRTVADGARDQVATNSIMGHADASMASVYRERIEDERLVAVAEHVRRWLWPETKETTPKTGSTSKAKAPAKATAKRKPEAAADDGGPVRLRLFAG